LPYRERHGPVKRTANSAQCRYTFKSGRCFRAANCCRWRVSSISWLAG